MKRLERLLATLGVIATATTMIGCEDTTGPEPRELDPPAFDVNGRWSMWEEVSSNCGDDDDRAYTIFVTQSGNDLTIGAPIGDFSGTISGSTIRWGGRFAEDGGTTTIDEMTLTVREVEDGDLVIDGSSRWSWSDGSFRCSGTSTVMGVREDD